MRPPKGFIIRLAVYWALLIYLALDLFVFTGPLRTRIRRSLPSSPESIAAAKAQGVVARVMGHAILLPQLERATKERLWLQGRTLESLPPAQRRVERLAALDELIDHQLLRVKAKANHGELPVPEEEIDEAVKNLKARYATEEEMQADLIAEGIDSEKELRLRLGGRIQRTNYVEDRISALAEVTEEEARGWYEDRAGELARPERVRVRHLFVATSGRDSAEARAMVERALADLADGKNFAALALELSEDEQSKAAGGDLGWMTKERLPADFAEPVFKLPMKRPTVLRTKLGWHLVEVTSRKPAEERTFEEAKDEVLAALETAKRREAVKEFRKALRAREGKFIEVFTDMVPE